MALALVKQLEKAESVVHDLFLEATDDGIEALEAVLEACRQSVMRRAEQIAAPGGGGPSKGRRGRGRRRGGSSRGGPGGQEPASGAEDTSAA